MSARNDAKNQAKLWLEAPHIFAEDLRILVDWIQQNVLIAPVDAGQRKRKAFLVSAAGTAEAIQRVTQMDMAVYEYGRGQRSSRVSQTLFSPLLVALLAVEETGEAGILEGFQSVIDAVEQIEIWAGMQQRSQERIGNRSETLKTTIEMVGDELFIRTDQEGSTRIRGATNIPMFMAFWQAHGHRMSREAFLDLNPSVNEKNLERHRVRLCGKLQDVLLEVVSSGNGYQLRRCAKS